MTRARTHTLTSSYLVLAIFDALLWKKVLVFACIRTFTSRSRVFCLKNYLPTLVNMSLVFITSSSASVWGSNRKGQWVHERGQNKPRSCATHRSTLCVPRNERMHRRGGATSLMSNGGASAPNCGARSQPKSASGQHPLPFCKTGHLGCHELEKRFYRMALLETPHHAFAAVQQL